VRLSVEPAAVELASASEQLLSTCTATKMIVGRKLSALSRYTLDGNMAKIHTKY